MLEATVSNRIAMLRPLLIVAMVYTHLRGVSSDMSDIAPGLFSHFNAFIIHGLGRGTVPTMSLIAGFLLFSMNLDLQAIKMFKKKFVTLVIPFFAFMLAYFVFAWVCEVAFGWTRFSSLISELGNNWANMLFGLNGYPANGPLHFVRDLIVFVLVAPIVGGIIRTVPVMGLLGFSVIIGTNMDGDLIFRGTSFLVFYIGGMAAIQKWDMLALDKHAVPCALLFVAICLGMMFFKIGDNTFLVLVAPFLIWPAASLLTGTKVEAWGKKYSKYSFFVFAAHMPIVELSWYLVSGPFKFVPYIAYWAITPFATMATLVVTYNLAMRYSPNAFNLMIGSRSDKPKRVERRKAPRDAQAPIYSEQERLTLAH